jgi:hypothetical protein
MRFEEWNVGGNTIADQEEDPMKPTTGQTLSSNPERANEKFR